MADSLSHGIRQRQSQIQLGAIYFFDAGASRRSVAIPAQSHFSVQRQVLRRTSDDQSTSQPLLTRATIPDLRDIDERSIESRNRRTAKQAQRSFHIALQNFEKIRTWSRALLASNRELLNQFLASRNDLQVRALQFGTVVFPRLLTGSVDRFCALFRQKYEGTVVPGSFFEMPDHFQLGIGAESHAVAASLKQLSAALDEFRGVIA